MDENTKLRLKLSRIYKYKKVLIQELSDLRKDLSNAVKRMYISESIPESQEFSTVFRDYEYIKLNRFIGEQINQLEKPLSGETEDIFESERENIQAIIDETVSQLSETVKKINSYITGISGDTDTVSVEKFLSTVRMKIISKIEKSITRELKPEIQKLKEKIDYIYRYENYSEIMGFLSSFEREVNLYLSQKGMEKISKIVEKHKKDFISEINIYMKKYIKSKKAQEKIVEEVSQALEEIDINRYSIHYSLPDIRKYFHNFSSSKSKIDIILSNLESPRFITIFLSGLVLFFGGLFAPVSETVKEITVLTGLSLTTYSFIDSAYFNRFYLRKYIKQIREGIKEEINSSLDRLIANIIQSITKTFIKIENITAVIIKRETKTVKGFENYLINLRNNIEKHIINISTIKKEFLYEISEEE
ncbi:hypothetical protein GWK41_01680 [Persephonella atlantica]|uniref:Uncharacterized protein n=1 Tax=Persephonella atlantica TaxID=2699429 RepID=A0ABS1GFS4_9AQUI|nr:hypothetical protein [Persephonella atlantica]MBK3331774.1 hypothetical protein [Persephonella atlantica]